MLLMKNNPTYGSEAIKFFTVILVKKWASIFSYKCKEDYEVTNSVEGCNSAE